MLKPFKFCPSLGVTSFSVCVQMLASSSTSSTTQLSQLGASLYGPQSKSRSGPFLNKSLFQRSAVGSPVPLLCRCSGVSHAGDEQQCSAPVESQQLESVVQSAAQSRECTQHELHAHATVAQQVPHSLSLTHTLIRCHHT